MITPINLMIDQLVSCLMSSTETMTTQKFTIPYTLVIPASFLFSSASSNTNSQIYTISYTRVHPCANISACAYKSISYPLQFVTNAPALLLSSTYPSPFHDVRLYVQKYFFAKQASEQQIVCESCMSRRSGKTVSLVF